ncbi:DUF2225 domain-containing protein [Peribacillus asahii]|mgnify:CR=1 FL=1|uniref:DUF2225 domain-containing protein n=1 Tax=Peribacillus asahii TaxID=228899 RepID=A0A398BBV6_9BACI|nr:DUF2225 domain-containing protein [Peribacillus asahii]RID85340.1 DUF2225 domain-containing protein [Peribacillus asahii]
MGELPPLFDKSIECLLCKQPATTKKIRSRFIKVSEYDTDFCPKYAEGTTNGLFYNIHVCPKCGFAFSKEFSKYFAPGTKEEISEKICSHWVPHSFSGERTINDAIQTYKLACYSAILKKEKHITIAGLYLRTAWLYRLKQNEEQEHRFMRLARREYEESFSIGDYTGTQVSEVRILYLLGELSRRIGELQAATKHFSMVLEKRKSAVETSIIQMARDRWADIKGEMPAH